MTLQACAELVRRGDPDRFLAAMAAPPSARAVLFPIYAFNVEVSRAPWVTQEPLIAEMRLQWWRDALAEIAEGGRVRRHEVTVPLAPVLDAEGARLLDALVAARRADIERAPFQDCDALVQYLDDTAGNLMWAAARALGSAEERDIRAVGRAAGLSRYLAAVPALVAAGREPLPPQADVPALCRRVLADWPRGKLRGRSRVAALEAWQARPMLRLAAREPSRVMEGALAPSEARKRLSLFRAMLLGP